MTNPGKKKRVSQGKNVPHGGKGSYFPREAKTGNCACQTKKGKSRNCYDTGGKRGKQAKKNGQPGGIKPVVHGPPKRKGKGSEGGKRSARG